MAAMTAEHLGADGRPYTWSDMKRAQAAAKAAWAAGAPWNKRFREISQALTMASAKVLTDPCCMVLYREWMQNSGFRDGAEARGERLEALALRIISDRIGDEPQFARDGFACAAPVPTLRRLCADSRAATAPPPLITSPQWDSATRGETYSWSVVLDSSRRWTSLPRRGQGGDAAFLLLADAPFDVRVDGHVMSPAVRVDGGRRRPPLYAMLCCVPSNASLHAVLEPDAAAATATLSVHQVKGMASDDPVALKPSPLCAHGAVFGASLLSIHRVYVFGAAGQPRPGAITDWRRTNPGRGVTAIGHDCWQAPAHSLGVVA